MHTPQAWKRQKDEERQRRRDEMAAREAAAAPEDKAYGCKVCEMRFISKNQLFKHLRAGGECSRLTGDVEKRPH
jgi:hypothetical protein